MSTFPRKKKGDMMRRRPQDGIVDPDSIPTFYSALFYRDRVPGPTSFDPNDRPFLPIISRAVRKMGAGEGIVG
jgi:hypothetical protein